MELTNDFEVGVPIEDAWAVLTDVERIAPCLPGAKLEEIEGDEYRGIVKVKVGPITAQYKGTATFVEKDDAGHRAVLSASGRDTRGQGNASATITAVLTEAGGRTKVHVATDLNVTGKVAQFGRGVMADVSAKLLDQFVENLESTVLSDAASEPAAVEKAPVAKKVVAKKAVAKKAVAKKAAAKKAVAAPAAASEPEARPSTEPKMAAETAVDPVSGNGVDPDQAKPAASEGVRKIDAPDPEPVDLMDAAGGSVARRIVPVVVGVVVIFLLVRWRRSRRRRG